MKQSSSHPNTEPENSNNINNDVNFASLKSGDYSGSFPKVEKWIREKSIQQNNKQAERKIVKMKNYVLAHKMKLVYTVIALAIIVGACSLPVTQNETIGHVLTWTLPGSSQTNNIDNLSWVDKSKLSISDNNNNGKQETIYTLMLPGSTDEQVQNYQHDLEKNNEVTSIKIFPLSENVKRPVYAAALHSFFRVNINATKMSDEELAKEVQKQLGEDGIQNVSLNIKTDENGKRMVKINLENPEKTPKDFELRIDDGKNQEVLKQKVKISNDPDKYKGKTDEEIKKLVKQEIGNEDIKDDDIKIERDQNGEVKIKVEVSKTK